MIAIFSGETDAVAYSNKIHDYLTTNRPGYNATKWCDPEQSEDGLTWFVKSPPEYDDNRWGGEPLSGSTELAAAITQTIPMPEIGELCEINNYYFYGGDILKCRQTHNRTIYNPKDTPALFSYFRGSSDFIEWMPNEEVQVGWERIYNSLRYRCIQSHMTQASWTPDVVPALWMEVQEEGTLSEWVQPTGAQDAYNKGDMVIFEGSVYQSTLDANVWSPTAYPVAWEWLYDL